MDKTTITDTDLVRIVDDLWGSMLNMNPMPVAVPVPDKSKNMVACVQVVGKWVGCVRLDISPPLARLATAAFLGVEPGEVSPDQMRDCAGELANITAGSVKLLIPAPSKISLPTVVEGDKFSLSVERAHKVGEIAFVCDGERFVLTVIESDDREDKPV